MKREIRPTRTGGKTDEPQTAEAAGVSDEDDVVDDGALSSHELLARELGAEVISDSTAD